MRATMSVSCIAWNTVWCVNMLVVVIRMVRAPVEATVVAIGNCGMRHLCENDIFFGLGMALIWPQYHWSLWPKLKTQWRFHRLTRWIWWWENKEKQACGWTIWPKFTTNISSLHEWQWFFYLSGLPWGPSCLTCFRQKTNSNRNVSENDTCSWYLQWCLLSHSNR